MAHYFASSPIQVGSPIQVTHSGTNHSAPSSLAPSASSCKQSPQRKRTLPPRELPNKTSVINQALVLSHKGTKLKDLSCGLTSFRKTDTLTKLLVLENQFAMAKNRKESYPLSWNEINTLLNDGYVPGDFNALPSGKQGAYISCMKDLQQAFTAAHEAYEDLDKDWYVHPCFCGKEIRLSYRQVCWYKEQGLPVPELCEDCLSQYTVH